MPFARMVIRAPQLSRFADCQLLPRNYNRSVLGSRENITVFCLRFLWGIWNRFLPLTKTGSSLVSTLGIAVWPLSKQSGWSFQAAAALAVAFAMIVHVQSDLQRCSNLFFQVGIFFSACRTNLSICHLPAKLNPSLTQGRCGFFGELKSSRLVLIKQQQRLWIVEREVRVLLLFWVSHCGLFFTPRVVCLLQLRRAPWSYWEKHQWCLKCDVFGCCSPCDEWAGLGWCGQETGDSADEVPVELFSNEILG